MPTRINSKKISVFIPVYKDSDLLESLLRDLTSDPYEQKEIFVTIDEPTDRSLKIVKKFDDKVKFIVNKKRNGKVSALNGTVKRSKGDIFLFLDADVKISKNSKNFLKNVVDEIEDVDVLDIKKRIIRDSVIAKMVNYEYISFNFTNWMFFKTIKRCMGINGAAFAIKRKCFDEVGGFAKIVSEDLDLGTKTLLKNKKFKYTKKAEVFTQSPSDWKKWFTQRKRWGVGAGLWIKHHYKNLIRYAIKYPYVSIPSLLILFPSLILFVLNYFLSNFLTYKVLTILLMFLATRFSLLIAPVFFISMGTMLVGNLIAIFMSLVFYSILFYFASRKLKFEFNVFEFFVYFFFYQPFSFLILIIGVIKAIVFSQQDLADWKV
jgi:cellulose synthase/poly-beta-1,6-N-acetylglucosamine synthase-like glycosyltransferase